MPVTEYRGMTLVAETPHRFGAAAPNEGTPENGHSHGENEHVHEDVVIEASADD
jgi:hypothetical protein